MTKPINRSGQAVPQQPAWPDQQEVARVRTHLADSPPLTTPSQIRKLWTALQKIQASSAFLLQAGDCAEPFNAAAVQGAAEKYQLIGDMAKTISSRLGVPVVTIGRIGGQFAKPRSQPVESIGDRELPVFRGLMVNSPEPHPAARTADASRLLTGYRNAALVLAELDRLANQSRDESTPFGETYEVGKGTWTHRGLWTSHEALLLDYEEPMIRRDSLTGQRFLLSTHLPWIGERTRRPDGEHISLVSGITNPVEVKIGPRTEPNDVRELCARLNPRGTPGRLILTCRMGTRDIRRVLPPLVRAVLDSGHRVIWVCDPMHGNLRRTSNGQKTRYWPDIAAELDGFLDILNAEGCWPGGVHLEVTGRYVTECLDHVHAADATIGPNPRYESLCDPRLNQQQSMRLAEHLAVRLST